MTQRYGPDIASVFLWLRANPCRARNWPAISDRVCTSVLADSVTAYRAGRQAEAQRLALGAYLEGFELAEASLDTVDRNLRQEVETQMIGYRDLMRKGAPAEQVAAAAQRIDGLLEASAQALGTRQSHARHGGNVRVLHHRARRPRSTAGHHCDHGVSAEDRTPRCAALDTCGLDRRARARCS